MTLVDSARLAAVLIAATGCATVTIPTPNAGSWLDNEGHALDEGDVKARLQHARFVLVGESHENKCDHEHEWAAADLMAGGGKWALGLEMITTDHQAVLDHFADGSVTLSGLPDALQWGVTWGSSFDWYAPAMMKANATNSPIIGLNASPNAQRIARDVGMDGVPMAERLDLTPTIIPPPTEQETVLKESFDAHQKASHEPSDKDAYARYVRAQAFSDTQMAWRAAQVWRSIKHRMLIVAGTGHIDHGWGIASRLNKFVPDSNIVTIMPYRGGALNSAAGDIFFYCPDTKASSTAP